MALRITATVETWPIAGTFTIARGAKREATVVVAHVGDGTVTGRGECVPYARYGETIDSVRDAILAMDGKLSDRASLQSLMPPGAARSALDCALWDFEAKRSGTSAVALAGLAALRPAPHRLHHQPRRSRSDGRQRRGGRAHQALAEAQAWRGWRRRAAALPSGRLARTRA